MEFKNSFHCRLVRNKLKFVAGHNIQSALDEVKSALQTSDAVERREAAGEDLARCVRPGKAPHFISLPLLQDENAINF